MTASLKAELEFGEQAESELLTLLNNTLFSGVTLFRTSQIDDFDYAAVKDSKLVGYVEFKRRRITSTKYETTIFTAAKLRTAIRLMELGYGVYIVIEFTDVIAVLDFHKLTAVSFSEVKRRDRNVPKLHAKIPLTAFTLYKKS